MVFRKMIGEQVEVEVQSLNATGEGVGFLEGKTFFVEGALPGETVQARLIQSKKRYARAAILAYDTPSPSRQHPVCPVFGQCGGCQIMHLKYEAQLEAKQKRVQDAIERIGHLKNIRVNPCIPSPKDLGYRNKIQLPVKGSRLGLYARASHDIVEMDTCYIHCSLGEEILKKIREALPPDGYSSLKYVVIRSSISKKEALALFVTNGGDTKKLKLFAKRLMQICPSLKGAALTVNRSNGSAVYGKNFISLAGRFYIEEELLGNLYKIPAPAFFQVNGFQAETLYRIALDFAALEPDMTLLDPFCGVGVFTLLAAKKCKKALGIECLPEAVDGARENAAINRIGNAEFLCGLAEEAIQEIYGIDALFLNPPRKGCRPELLEKAGKLAPKTIVYMSCDPATLARDLAILDGQGYSIEAVQPVDMFPQTMHVETVVKLECK